MNLRIIRFSFILIISTFLSGCLGGVQVKKAPETPSTAILIKDHIVYLPTTWSGDVRITKPIIVTKGSTLTLREGTRVFFDIPEPAQGTTKEPWILVQGAIVAMGSPEMPILFTSASPRNQDFDDMIAIREAKEAIFQNCIFEFGPWGIHIHDTPTRVNDCIFRNNFGGMRFKGDNINIKGNVFSNNTLGIRCLMGSPVIEENTFDSNLTGIFFREGIGNISLKHNNFSNEEYDLKMGENQTADVDASGNWWQAEAKGNLNDKIYDLNDSEDLGRVILTPTLAAPWSNQEMATENK